MTIAFIIKEMSKHLIDLLFVNAAFAFLFQAKRLPRPEYNVELVRQPTNSIVISALVIGISSAVFSFSIVAAVMLKQNPLVVVAALFISFGTGRQLISTSLDTVTANQNTFLSCWASLVLSLSRKRLAVASSPEWHSIESRAEMILIGRGFGYSSPVDSDELRPESSQALLDYLNGHKWELNYQRAIAEDDSSCLEFVRHATQYWKEELRKYDRLKGLQDSSGGVHTIILVAIGTLIWLVS